MNKSYVNRVIDGDTFCCKVDLEYCVSIEITVRLLEVDTWEMTGEHKELGRAAKKFLSDLILDKFVNIFPLKKDSFGRWLCFAYINDENISEVMKTYQKDVIRKLELKNNLKLV